jgi:hypothetical protein
MTFCNLSSANEMVAANLLECFQFLLGGGSLGNSRIPRSIKATPRNSDWHWSLPPIPIALSICDERAYTTCRQLNSHSSNSVRCYFWGSTCYLHFAASSPFGTMVGKARPSTMQVRACPMWAVVAFPTQIHV